MRSFCLTRFSEDYLNFDVFWEFYFRFGSFDFFKGRSACSLAFGIMYRRPDLRILKITTVRRGHRTYIYTDRGDWREITQGKSIPFFLYIFFITVLIFYHCKQYFLSKIKFCIKKFQILSNLKILFFIIHNIFFLPL